MLWMSIYRAADQGMEHWKYGWTYKHCSPRNCWLGDPRRWSGHQL
jgi:hypothetical protein